MLIDTTKQAKIVITPHDVNGKDDEEDPFRLSPIYVATAAKETI